MNIQDSIRLCMRDYKDKEYESAMLHVCTAIDGVAAKMWPLMRSKQGFLKLIRGNYDVIEAVAFPASYFEESLFPIPPAYLERFRETRVNGNEYIGKQDLANLIYVVHRCVHCHGSEIPESFKLITEEPEPRCPEDDGHTAIHYGGDGSVRLSGRIIPALAMVAVLQDIEWGNTYVKGMNKYIISCEVLGEMPINDWWGRKKDFLRELRKNGYPQNADRIAIQSELDKTGKLCGFCLIHEDEFPRK